MSPRLNRRSFVAAAPVALGTLFLDPTPGLMTRSDDGDETSGLAESYPAQEASAVREVVTVSHFSLERVRALVEDRPELAKSAWDWGFGDWESALGAASHTGNRDIAEYLIEHGARANIFTVAMMGDLGAVRAFVEAMPGIQRQPGPHGITLRRHAELGGDPARAVLEYLDHLGDADIGPTNLPLDIDQQAYVGTYLFGPRTEDHFEIAVGSYRLLTIQRGDGSARNLFHQGDHIFHPAGAPSARIHFQLEADFVRTLEIHNPGRIVSAVRSLG